MNKYKVTSGDVTRVVEAANEAAARRKFSDVPTTVTVVELLGEPEKCRYRVTWGDETREVEALNETDAWTQFVGENTDSEAYKRPATHHKIIEKLDDEKPKSHKPVEGKVSPVVNESAELAIDNISRMRSREHLQEIIAYDTRSTVAAAAKKRLAEL